MATVVHRKTGQIRLSVDTSELPGDPRDWLVNPALSAVAGVPAKYWAVEGEAVREMTADEKAAVDATELPGHKAAKLEALRQEAIRRLAEATGGYRAAKAEVEAATDKTAVDKV